MAVVSGSLTAAGQGAPFAPTTTRFRATASGEFAGAAVLMRSADSGATWQALPGQGRAPGAPLFAGGNGAGLGSATAEISDAAAGVLYAMAAVSPPAGTWLGELDFAFTDVALATVTVTAGGTLNAGGASFTAGQTVTISRTDADLAYRAGVILPGY